MVSICNIVPNKHLSLTKSDTSNLVLAKEYMEFPDYAKYYQSRAYYENCVILDNNAYEDGKSISSQELLEIAQDLKPTYVILPDVRFDKDATLANARDCIEKFKNKGFKVLAVPQGNCFEDVVKCHDEFSRMPIDGYAIYEEIGVVCNLGNRANFLKFLESTGRVYKNHYIHCLGMEENLLQTVMLGKFKWVQSVDSAKPFVYGMHRMAIEDPAVYLKYPHRPKNYFTREVVDRQAIQCIIQNMYWIQRVINH